MPADCLISPIPEDVARSRTKSGAAISEFRLPLVANELVVVSLRLEETIEPCASGRSIQKSCIFFGQDFEIAIYVTAIAKLDFQLAGDWVIASRSDAGGIGNGLPTH